MYFCLNYLSMKKIFLVALVMCFSFGYTQSKFKPGVYVSQGDQKGIELKINQDNTYELIFLSGKIQNENDTLLLKNKYSGKSLFQVEEIKNTVNVSTLEINFNYKYFDYFSSKIFIGLQKTENDDVEYKNILDFMDNKPSYREEGNKLKFSVDRPKYIYLVNKEKSKIGVSKFLINENVSGLEIKAYANSISNLELKAYFKDENSIIVTEGKQPLLFTMVNQDVTIPETILEPIEVDNDAKIILPVAKDSFENEDEVAFESVNEAYVFKHKVDATLKEALVTMKKTPNKFLVVAQNSSKEDFDSFIQQNEVELTNNMYYEYYAEYDKYNYYLATEKDKKSIPSTSKEEQIFVLNAEGEVVYHTKGSLEENKKLFGSYSPISEALAKVNVFATIDRLFVNKKSTVQEIKTIFTNIIKLEIPYDYAIVDKVTMELPPPPSVKEIEEANEVDYAVDEAVATEDYYNIKDKQNLYQLQTTKEVVMIKWKQVLDFYLKQNEFDAEVVKILKNELTDDGFSIKLFNDKKETFSTLDYLGLDYLLKFYKQIKSDATTVKFEAEEDYYSYDQNIDNAISEILNKRASTYYDYPKEDKLKALAYYKKYLAVAENNSTVLSNYLSLLNANLNILDSKSEYYNAYENYYNAIVELNPKSLIEALDVAFEKSELTDWFDFKYSFSSLANDVSWSVVENEIDPQLIKNAIKWSEASLKVNKTNSYYLDTLAQLYYKDGQKEKAIDTQNKALTAMKGEEESVTYIEMKNVLVKMQNGTY